MRFLKTFGWATLGVLGAAIAVACSSSSSNDNSTTDGGPAQSCSPGQSIACAGAGGCSGSQVCNADGTAYGACACGSGNDSGAPKDASASDDGSDGAVGWTPRNLGGLLLWVDGQNFGDAGATITDWPDQSGHGFDLTTSAAASAPSIVANAIGGLPAVKFVPVAADDALAASSPDLAVSSDNFIIELVFSVPNSAPDSALAVLGLPAGDQAELSAGGGTLNGRFTTGGDIAIATYSDAPHIAAFRRSGLSTAELRLDGVATPITLATTHTLGAAFSVGDGLSSASIAEVVVQQSPTNDDVLQLESYLKAKYGL